jgi:hypothetical protein
MIAIDFDKAKARHFLDRLQNGGPIEPQEARGWTVTDALALAGACHYMVTTHASNLREAAGGGGWEGMGDKQREDTEHDWDRELEAAIGFLSHLTMLVAEEKYDASFAPRCRAVVASMGGKVTVQPVKGMPGIKGTGGKRAGSAPAAGGQKGALFKYAAKKADEAGEAKPKRPVGRPRKA